MEFTCSSYVYPTEELVSSERLQVTLGTSFKVGHVCEQLPLREQQERSQAVGRVSSWRLKRGGDAGAPGVTLKSGYTGWWKHLPGDGQVKKDPNKEWKCGLRVEITKIWCQVDVILYTVVKG